MTESDPRNLSSLEWEMGNKEMFTLIKSDMRLPWWSSSEDTMLPMQGIKIPQMA